ncbi:MAG: cysteine dioxygenase family protein [Chitinophagales bacterium]|nr:cysteine dioxygenase family protein [Chitinophagales bacterium]
MEKLIFELNQLKDTEINPAAIKQLLQSIDCKYLKFIGYRRTLRGRGYKRIKLPVLPVEALIMIWPPKVASAIHSHHNYWGYVKILEGNAMEDNYIIEGKQPVKIESRLLRTGSLVQEQEGAVHCIRNVSEYERLVTLHVYYPPQRSLAHTALFDLENNRFGILNEQAVNASWNEPGSSFFTIANIN